MDKAILELDMPDNCNECIVCDNEGVCKALGRDEYNMPAYTPKKGRREDCPMRYEDDEDICYICAYKDWVEEYDICYTCAHMCDVRRKYYGGTMIKCADYKKGEALKDEFERC